MTAIFCRVGWMSKYNGPEPEEIFFNKTEVNWWKNQPQGERSCGEFWNFLPGDDSVVRGFTMIKAKNKAGDYTGTIKIERLGADKKDEYVDGITIIFFAPSPHDKKNYVIGWYESARIYRTWRKDGNNTYRNGEFYSFETKPENAYLIPVDQRSVEIITMQERHPGQSFIFYRERNPTYVDSIVDKIAGLKIRGIFVRSQQLVEFAKDTRSTSGGSNDLEEDRFDDPAEPFLRKEGRTKLRLHLQKERSARLIERFKSSLDSHKCWICEFEFERSYGELGKGFIEAHHITPIASINEGTLISENDLAAVCSNCHRMLHKVNPPIFWKDS